MKITIPMTFISELLLFFSENILMELYLFPGLSHQLDIN